MWGEKHIRRYCFYIDGLNVYHAIVAAAPQYLWLDYGALARNVIGAKDTVHQVLYFTTIARFKPHTIKPHEQYKRPSAHLGSKPWVVAS